MPPFLSSVIGWKPGRGKGETDFLPFLLHMIWSGFLRRGTNSTAVVSYLVSKLNVDWITVLKCNGSEWLLVWKSE